MLAKFGINFPAIEISQKWRQQVLQVIVLRIYSSNQNIIDVARDMMDPPQYDMLSFLQGQRKSIWIFYILVENLMCINGCVLLWILI